MEEQRAIDDHRWASGMLWNACKEQQPLHMRGRGASAQKELQTLQRSAVEMFLGCPAQRTDIREWLELALGEPPEYEISPTGGDACSQIEQEYATHYTQCLWDLQPPNPTGFEAKLESLKRYHHGFRRSIELKKLKEKRLQNKKKRNSESGQSESLDPEDSAPNGKETALGLDHCTPQSENTRVNDLLQPFLAETDAVQLPQVDRFGSTVEEDTSPVPVVDQQSGTPISLAIGEPPLAGDSTLVPSADAAPEHGRTSPMIDIWGDDESLTELSSDESVGLEPSSKKPKFSYGAESEIDEPPRPPPPVPTRVADHDEPASAELSSREPSPDHGEEPGIDEPESEDPIFEPSPKKPKFSYRLESEIDEPSSPRSPRPIMMPNSDTFRRGSTARKSKPKRRNAQSRAATQPPRVSEKSRRITRSSSSTPGVDGLSVTQDRDAPGIQRVAPVLAPDAEPAAPTVSSAGELDGHDVQASAGQLPPSVVGSPPTTSNGKRTKRKRTNSLATFLLDATAINHPGETAKPRRKERSARGDGTVRIAPSQFPTKGRRAQNAGLSVYAEIALEEKARSVKRAKKLRPRPGTATQDTRIAEPSRVPNIPSTDAAGLFQQETSLSSTLQSSLPSTETSIPAGILLDDGTRLFKERPSASTLEASRIDGTRRLVNYESMDRPMEDANALSPPMGGVGASSSGRRWVSPTFGGPEILSSPPAEQSRRRKRKRKQVDHPDSIQKQRALQRDVPVNRAATTAEEAPHVSNLQSWSREAAQKPSQTVPKGHKTAEGHAENRKDVQKERNPVKSSGIGPPEFTSLDSLFRQWASPTSALFQLLNYVQEPSQGETPPCLDVEGVSDVAQSRLPSEPVVLASSSNVFPGTDADSPQSAHSAGDDVVGGEESDATRGATTQPQSPGLTLRPPPKVPDTSSPPSDQVLLSPPEIPPSTRPLASIVPDEIPTVQYPRPRLPAEPQVWCMTRQELCEGTAYFRSYQGGVYANGGLARGYMLDGYGAPRDICAHNARLIISHAGGSSHQVTRLDLNGRKITNTELKQDQEVDNGYARYLYANWKLGKPVVLLVGKNYSLFPFDVEGKSYVILGWYRIIQMWTELESMPDSGKLFKRLKVAFQWIAGQGAPFFDVPGAASRTTPPDRSIFKIPVHCHVTQDLPLPDVLGL
ncbi:hypothetical protein FRC04_004473 [Tulasnella sp. 424]|nr:hypothetical protein FRC04_004473 [Tulasnella sp. 424]